MKHNLTYPTSLWRYLLLATCIASAYPNAAAASEPRTSARLALQAARYPTMPATSIEEVVERLSEIVAVAQARGDRVGYFAALYRQITREILRGIQRGAFDDGPRMDRFDTVFANRYFAALEAWQSGGTMPACWRQAFELTRADDTIIAQHVFSALAAHIGYDLPLAAAAIAPGLSIYALKRDYDRVNDILIDVLGDVQAAMAEVSPDLGLLDELAGDLDEGVFGVSIVVARGHAWEDAVMFARTSARFRPVLEYLLDANTAALETLISQPVRPLYELIQLIRETEEQDVATVIEQLDGAIP
jgi:hypothetical protein